MDTIFDNVNDFFKSTTKLMFNLFSLAIIVEVIFGNFFGWSLIDSVIDIVAKLGNEGFVGIIALIILFNFLKNRD